MSGESMSAVSWLFEEGIVHSVSYGNNIVMDVEARNEVYRKARSLEKRLSSGNTVDPASKDL
jgi:GTP-binding protein HflX